MERLTKEQRLNTGRSLCKEHNDTFKRYHKKGHTWWAHRIKGTNKWCYDKSRPSGSQQPKYGWQLTTESESKQEAYWHRRNGPVVQVQPPNKSA